MKDGLIDREKDRQRRQMNRQTDKCMVTYINASCDNALFLSFMQQIIYEKSLNSATIKAG